MKKLKLFLMVCAMAGLNSCFVCRTKAADFFVARPFVSRSFYYRSNQVPPPVYWNTNPSSGYIWSTNPYPAYNFLWNTNPYPAYNYGGNTNPYPTYSTPYGNANPYPVYNYVIPYNQGSYPSAYPYSPAFNPSLYVAPSGAGY